MTPRALRALKRLSRAEHPAAAALLGDAMAGDPLYLWLCPGDPGRRARWLRWVFAAALDLLAPPASAYAVEGAPGTLEGAIVLNPPGAPRAPLRRRLALAVRAILRARAERPPLGNLIAAARAESLSETLHPAAPHWHIVLAGVRADLRGGGLGRMLLEGAVALAAAEAGGAALYLETTNERNVGFYERFGFRVERRLALAGEGSPTLWTMLRSVAALPPGAP